MKKKLNYTIINAHAVTVQREVEIDGQAATATFQRAEIEAAPHDKAGKTLSLVLDELGSFEAGMDITITVEAA